MKSAAFHFLAFCIAPLAFAAPGTLTINGNLTVNQGAIIEIEAAGVTAGTQHDKIIVDGALTLVNGGAPAGPTLNVTAISGFVGATGNVLDILDFTSQAGTFATINLPLGGWQTTDLYTLGQLNFQSTGGGFAAWLTLNGLANGTDDNDFDSLTNLAEYALGGIPVTGVGSNSAGLLPKPNVAGVAPNEKLNFLFKLPDPPPSDVKYTIQGHENLSSTWTDLATKTGAGAWSGTATVTAGSPAGGYIPYTLEDVQVITGVPRRFMRLKMEIVP